MSSRSPSDPTVTVPIVATRELRTRGLKVLNLGILDKRLSTSCWYPLRYPTRSY